MERTLPGVERAMGLVVAVALVVSGGAPDIGSLSCQDVGPLTGLWRGVVTSVERQITHEITWLLYQLRQTPTEVWGYSLEVIPADALPPQPPRRLPLYLSGQLEGRGNGEGVILRVVRARTEVKGHLVDLSPDLARYGMVTLGSRMRMQISHDRKTLQGEGESRDFGRLHLRLEKAVKLCS